MKGRYKQMEKIAKTVNQRGYLIGVYNNEWIYLERPSWDCGWYWGFGDLHYHRRNNLYWNTHTHFDSVFFNNGNCTPKEWKNKTSFNRFRNLDKSTLSESDIWKLLDYMNTFYTLKEAAAVFGRGRSHYTSEANLDIIENAEICDHINKVMLPALFKEIDTLLTVE